MHKIRVIESTLGYPQKNRMESESYEGVQTYMDMKDGSLIAVQPNKDDLMSQILSPDNLNRAYLPAGNLLFLSGTKQRGWRC